MEYGKDVFWEHTIRDDRDYAAHVDYVHINPFKHGLVQRVSDWPYSSFHRFVAEDMYPIDWAGEAVEMVAGERGSDAQSADDASLIRPTIPIV